MQRGRNLFCVLALSLIVLMLVTVRQLPPVVASHFDLAGVPNGWSSRASYTILLLAIGILLPLGIVGLMRMLTRSGPEPLNIPARDYWLRPEHRHEAVLRVQSYIWWLCCIMVGTILAIHGLILAAHEHEPPRLSSSWTFLVLGGAVLAIGVWGAGWYRLLRRPS